MEDQQADSGDLTPDTANPPVPQNKTTRRRHRLPRGQARIDAADTSAEASPPDEPTADPTLDSTPVEAAETAPESAEVVPESSETAPESAETAPESADVAESNEPEPVGEPDTNESADVAESSEPESPEPETDDVEEAEEPVEPVLVPHRPAGRLLKSAAILAAVLFVAAAAFLGATAQRYLLDRAEVHVKLDIARTAADAITTLFTYSPDDLEQLPQRSSGYLSGDFNADYKRYIDSIVAPNKQAQVSNRTQVLGAAVESLSGKEATAIVYTNSVSTSPVTKGVPSLQYRSYRLDMKRDQRRWFVTRMVPITTLDLTPRL